MTDIVVLVLALTISLAILALTASAVYVIDAKGAFLSDKVVGLLSTILGAAVGAVTTFLGMRWVGQHPLPPLSDGTGPLIETPIVAVEEPVDQPVQSGPQPEPKPDPDYHGP
jgi:hypothetical protein